MTDQGADPVRCAICTRKSSEEGLQQGFNSLHSQREYCEAFIRSQAGEGWRIERDHYDDGGHSGGTLERPALRRLMAEVSARRVDAVVVYKVDRLTRSLSDFAKLIEAFDKAKVSFVSVTQQFNTTSSIGLCIGFEAGPRRTIAYHVDFKGKCGSPPGSRSAPIGTPVIRWVPLLIQDYGAGWEGPRFEAGVQSAGRIVRTRSPGEGHQCSVGSNRYRSHPTTQSHPV